MLMGKGKLWIVVVVAILIVTGTMFGTAAAQKASVPKPQNKLAMGEDGVKQLLPLMDSNKNGFVSKQEFMKYMEAEFERLDKSKKGELNVKELTQSNLTASRFAGK
jgi:Ca2+-binding EF-hand superfamily protein